MKSQSKDALKLRTPKASAKPSELIEEIQRPATTMNQEAKIFNFPEERKDGKAQPKQKYMSFVRKGVANL